MSSLNPGVYSSPTQHEGLDRGSKKKRDLTADERYKVLLLRTDNTPRGGPRECALTGGRRKQQPHQQRL